MEYSAFILYNNIQWFSQLTVYNSIDVVTKSSTLSIYSQKKILFTVFPTVNENSYIEFPTNFTSLSG